MSLTAIAFSVSARVGRGRKVEGAWRSFSPPGRSERRDVLCFSLCFWKLPYYYVSFALAVNISVV